MMQTPYIKGPMSGLFFVGKGVIRKNPAAIAAV